MKSRVGTLCLALLLLVSLWIPGAAAGVPTFEVTAPTEPVEAGELFDVTVSLRDNPGFYAIQFTLAFDHERMECTGIRLGAMMDGVLSVRNPNGSNGAIVAGAVLEGVFEDGIVATVRFRASADGVPEGFSLRDYFISDESGKSYDLQLLLNQGGDLGTEEGGTPSGTQAPPEEGEGEENGAPAETPSSPAENGENESGASGDQPSSSGGEDGGNGQSAGVPSSSGGTDGHSSGGSGGGGQTPVPTAEAEIDFPDIQNHWGREAILKAAKLGLFKGYEDGTFGPNDPVTRVQLVTVLYRLSGSPEVTEEAPFTDIAREIPEFRAAVSWAYANGYVNGRTETTFDPRTGISRQETMTILFRLSGGQSGMEALFTSTYDQAYTDSDQIASWAKKAVYWGVYKEIIRGTSEVTIDPKGTTTRAQMATLLVNYIEKTMD